jgi:hypothetical protein
MFVHELIAAPAQTERMAIASKIIKLLVKSIKELNYALADICCSVLTSTEGVPPPLEFANAETDGSSYQKLLPVISDFCVFAINILLNVILLQTSGALAHAAHRSHIACALYERSRLVKVDG